MVRYSDWIWSDEHKKHYCAVYDDNDNITEYQWEGGYRQQVAESSETTTTTPAVTYTTGTTASTTSHSSGSPQQLYAKQRADSGVHTSSPFQYTSTAQPYTTNAYESTAYQYSQNPYTQPSSYVSAAELPGDIQATVGGNKVSRHVKTGADGLEYEKLHPSFKRVSAKDQEAFFRRGRVFKMLWTEPAGQPMGKTRGSTHYSIVRFQEGAYSEIRRFVVIQNKGTFSQCIPIQTYRGQGATKPGLIIGDHAMIYTGSRRDRAPQHFQGEEAMNKHPIRVEPISRESLDPASRINFGKPYAVEHNVKLAEIGLICSEHEHLLITYFMEAMGINT